ncbi:hypothetical protein J6590_087827 [Homalodisca vitripennis]|nr:hypothetical protein J6590_087827 [Homalodisca vitripennis]
MDTKLACLGHVLNPASGEEPQSHRDVFKAASLELKLYINRTNRIYCSKDVFSSRKRTPVSPRCVEGGIS